MPADGCWRRPTQVSRTNSSHPASAGTAKYFAVMGSDIKTWPASSSNLVLRYYEAIPDLATASTNWLLTKCPGLYLYGSLIEAAAFMMDDGRIPVWGALYDNLKRGLLDEDLRSNGRGHPCASKARPRNGLLRS